MAEKMDEIPSNEENRDHNSPAEYQNGRPPRGESVIFSYDDLKTATNNFSSTLGEGVFGIVYKGKLPKTDQIVAVKKLRADSTKQGVFQMEVFMLSILRHRNIINLIGFSAERTNPPLLVYEFMPERSLDKHLYDIDVHSKQLEWKTRMKIALGTAKALNYLHNEAKPPVVFKDLKSANILLDKSFHPKLSDFGIADFNPMPPSGSTLMEHYALLIKDDVYGFGVVLLELITGIQVQEDQNPFAWLNSMRSKLKGAMDPRLEAADVALACLHENPFIRSDMRDVERALNAIVDNLDNLATIYVRLSEF